MGKVTRQELSDSLRAELDSVRDYIAGSNNAEFGAHMSNISNPHAVTKTQVGLGELINVRQAAESAFQGHQDNVANPHNVTTLQIGAVPITRQINTGAGLSGGGFLSMNKTLELDFAELNSRYLPKAGGVISGALTAKSLHASGTIGGYVFTNIVETNGMSTHLYLRPTYATEVRVTKAGTTDKYESIRSKSFLSQFGQPAYHKKEDIKWGTGSPSGGEDGDIFIQY